MKNYDVTTRLRTLVRDDRGSIAILFSLSLLAVLLAVGLSIDGARAYNVSSRVMGSLDAAALAAGRLLDDDTNTDTDIQNQATAFFNIHWRQKSSDLTISPPVTTVDRTNFEVTVAVNISFKTSFGQLAGVPAFEFPRSTTVAYRTKKVELALVLDTTGSMCQPCTKIDGLKLAAKDVVETMLDGTHPPGTMKLAVVPYSASVNAGAYASLVSGGASADSCVVERNGGDAFTDAPATVGNRLNAITTVPPNGNYSCPGNDVFPLSEDKAQLRAKIDALTAGGGTAGHIGAAWGWYMVSPNWGSLFPRGSRGRSYSDKSVIKSVLLMTDGEFNTSYQAAGQNSTDRAIIGSSPYQALALCDSMKRQGIEVWTIGFQASPAAENLLRDCATDGGHFISAVDTTSLRAAFLEVARRLTALRLSN